MTHLLFYNIQGFNPYDNNKCNNINRYNGDYNDVVSNNSPQDINGDSTIHIQDNGAVNYVVYNIV